MSAEEWTYCVDGLPEESGTYEVSVWERQPGVAMPVTSSFYLWFYAATQDFQTPTWGSKVKPVRQYVYAWRRRSPTPAPLRQRDLLAYNPPAEVLSGLES